MFAKKLIIMSLNRPYLTSSRFIDRSCEFWTFANQR